MRGLDSLRPICIFGLGNSRGCWVDNWFYNVGGKRLGPVTEGDLQSLFANGTISGDTLVWSAGSGGDWRKFDEVEQFKPPAGSSPPPLPPSAIIDRWAWGMALTPLPMFVLDVVAARVTGRGFDFGTYALISLIFYLTFLALDGRAVSEAGYGSRMRGAGAWLLITPAAYLFARSRRLGKSLLLGFVWIAAFLLPILFLLWVRGEI